VKLRHVGAVDVDGEGPGFDWNCMVSCRLQRHLESRVGVKNKPGIGQEFLKLNGGMRRQPFQSILQIGERIDPVTRTTSHKTVQRRRRPTASITPDEQCSSFGYAEVRITEIMWSSRLCGACSDG